MSPPWTVELYERSPGRCATTEFLQTLSKNDQVRVERMIDLLQQRGHELRRPHTERLRKDICELRIHGEVGQIRLLYFLFDGAKIVITHGFVKKGNAVPPGEIDKAEAIRSAYYAASGKG